MLKLVSRLTAAIPALALFAIASPSAAQFYSYQQTLGQTLDPGVSNSQFASESGYAAALDPANNHLIIVDLFNQREQIFDAESLGYVATLGVTGVSGSDNEHFNEPGFAAVDAAGGRIFVPDIQNQRVQIFNAKTLAYAGTMGVPGVAGSDNRHFSSPGVAAVVPQLSALFIGDQGNCRVQVFNLADLSYRATLGVSGQCQSGLSSTGQGLADNAHLGGLGFPAYNPATGDILVVDGANVRVQVFDANLSYKKTLGVTGVAQLTNDHFFAPSSVAYDPTLNVVLVGDEARVQIFNAETYSYIATFGTGSPNLSANGLAGAIFGIVVDPARHRIALGDFEATRVDIDSIAAPATHASILPGSRSVEVGTAATIFAAIVNSSGSSLSNCQIELPSSAPTGLSLTYQTTNPATNAPTGMPNSPATIPGNNGLQTFVLSFTASSPVTTLAQSLDFECGGVSPAPLAGGVDTADLVFSLSPTADVIALAATASNNGIIAIPVGGTGAFALATSNVGISAELTVSVDTGAAFLPIAAKICQTIPTTGACTATPAASITVEIRAGTTPTFAVFATATSPIALDPGNSRIFVRFEDAAGLPHGLTSVAVQTS